MELNAFVGGSRKLVIPSIFMVFLGLFAFPGVADAQLLRSYGLKLALTSANQDFHYTTPGPFETKRRIGVNAGAFAEWLNIPLLSIVTQVEYAQRGMGVEFVLTGPTSLAPIGAEMIYSRVDYLSIPVMAKLRFQAGLFSPYIIAGPRADFMLGYSSDRNSSNDVYDGFRKSILGDTVGLGVGMAGIIPVRFLTEIRYNFDLQDSFSNSALTVRNNAVDIWLGVEL